MLQKIKQSNFYIRLTNWEYWPLFIVNIPIMLFWAWYAIRSRSLFFFARTNPAIETGGVLGESKIKILDQVPQEWKPQTIFIPRKSTCPTVMQQLKAAGLDYPIIAKPNVGERGFMVAKINNDQELDTYIKQSRADFIIQEYIDYPLEFGVLHYRFPDATSGTISSLCVKEFLSVTGDGQSTVRQLMAENPRARLQMKRLLPKMGALAAQVPGKGEKIKLEPIGNHCRGTMFLNGNHMIDDALTEVFDKISHQLEGIYYCRYDIRCRSLEELKKGTGFSILEINGIASDPGHIYDPGYSIVQAYRDIFHHWRIIYQISRVQRKKGVRTMSLKEAAASFRAYRQYMRTAKA